MNELNTILEYKPMGYTQTISVPNMLYEIDWNVNDEIYKGTTD